MEEKTYYDWLTEDSEEEKRIFAEIDEETDRFNSTPEYKAYKERLDSLYKQLRCAHEDRMKEAQKHRVRRPVVKSKEDATTFRARVEQENKERFEKLPMHMQDIINAYNSLSESEKTVFTKECWRANYGEIKKAENPQTTQKNLEELLTILVQTTIDYINDNGLKDIQEVHFGADSLQESAKYGEWSPATDASIKAYGAVIEDQLSVRTDLGEYF